MPERTPHVTKMSFIVFQWSERIEYIRQTQYRAYRDKKKKVIKDLLIFIL